jgi:hypothetical protein
LGVRTLLWAFLATRVAYSVGCDCGGAVQSDSGTPDGGASDAGTGDSGSPDSGTTDAGGPDGGVPLAFVQASAVAFSTATGQLTLPQAVASGDTIVVTVAFAGDAGINSVTDSSGRALALAAIGGNQDTHATFYAAGVDGGIYTVVVSLSNSLVNTDIHVLEYAGIDTVSPLDLTSNNSGVGNVGSGTLNASANELIYAYLGSPSVAAEDAGGGFTVRELVGGNLSADLIAIDAGSYTVTAPLSGTGPWHVLMVGFRGQ